MWWDGMGCLCDDIRVSLVFVTFFVALLMLGTLDVCTYSRYTLQWLFRLEMNAYLGVGFHAVTMH